MAEEPKRQDEPARVSVENIRWVETKNWWGNIAKHLLNHATLVLTLLYLYAAAIGMIYSGVLYGRFGINIFDYSEIGNFLLTAFKNPIAFLVVVLQVLSIPLIVFAGARVHRRHWRGRFLLRSRRQAYDRDPTNADRLNRSSRLTIIQSTTGYSRRGKPSEEYYGNRVNASPVEEPLVAFFSSLF